MEIRTANWFAREWDGGAATLAAASGLIPTLVGGSPR